MINRTLVALVATVALALSGTAAASAATVSGGSFTWTSANVYETTAPTNTNRTWLGYITTLSPVTGTEKAQPGSGATGDTVTSTSAKGASALYSWTFGAGQGTYDAATGTGTISFSGTLTQSKPAHGVNFTFTNPVLVLNGRTGTLAFSGIPGAPAPLFNLDLGNATVTDAADGTRTISGIVPSIARTDVFGGSYAVGAGPNRTPNTFGSFSVTLKDATAPTFQLVCPSGLQSLGGSSAATLIGASDDWSGFATTPSALAPLDTSAPGGGFIKTVTLTDKAGNSASQSCGYKVGLPTTRVSVAPYKKGALPRITLKVEAGSEVTVVLKKHVQRGDRNVIVRIADYERTFTSAGTATVNVRLTDWGRKWLKRLDGASNVTWTTLVKSAQGTTGLRGALPLTGSAS